MIITRTPFRISFAGGGSDLEAYYRDEAGVVLGLRQSTSTYILPSRNILATLIALAIPKQNW